jgi:IBR (half RING finger) domain-containing protein
MAAKQALRNEPNFFYCAHLGCNSGQIHEEANRNPKMVCLTCGEETCVRHGCTWHEGETCRKYDKRREEQDKELRNDEEFVSRLSKQCPKEERL